MDTVDAAAERVARLTRQIEAQVAEWSLAPLVTTLQAMRGVALIVAVTLVAEIGDLRRFAGPRLAHHGVERATASPATSAAAAPA